MFTSRDTPKFLQRINGVPFGEIFLASFLAYGIRSFHFCLGHLAAPIIDFLRTYRGDADITYTIEPYALGTAGAVTHALDFLAPNFLLVNGDTYVDLGMVGAVTSWAGGPTVTMLLTTVGADQPPNVLARDGVVLRHAKDGVESGLTDTGIALVRRDALRPYLPAPGTRRDLEEVYAQLARHRLLGAVKTSLHYWDVGTPERLKRFAASSPGSTSADRPPTEGNPSR